MVESQVYPGRGCTAKGQPAERVADNLTDGKDERYGDGQYGEMLNRRGREGERERGRDREEGRKVSNDILQMHSQSCTLTLSVGGAGGGNATLSGWNCFTATT